MEPWYSAPDARLYHGDCRDVLAALPAGSVHCCVSSPPYFGLRQYAGVEPSVWGGERECEHLWTDELPGDPRGGSGTPTDKNNRGEGYARQSPRGRYCRKCHAWLGCLGLEPTVDCGHAGEQSDELTLRDDLTEEERQYVITELLRLGVIR